MKGKDKCKILKQIRSDIANANDIPLEIPECTHKGDCKGTCPRCEAEVKYLERQLADRRKRGFKIAVAGISAGLVALNAASCDIIDEISSRVGGNTLQGDMIVEHSDGIMPPPDTTELGGEVVDELEGNVTEVETLEGDVAVIEPQGDIAYDIIPDELIQGGIPVYTDGEEEQ